MNLSEVKDRLQALYNPDPAGTKRKMEIKNEHSTRIKQSANRRDQEIELAINRHGEDIEAIDNMRTKKLEQLEAEIRDERRKEREFARLLEKLNDYAVMHGERKYITTDFAPVPTLSSTRDHLPHALRRSQFSHLISFNSLASKVDDKDRTSKHAEPATRFSFSLLPPKTSDVGDCNILTPRGHRQKPNNKRKSEATDPTTKKYRPGPPENSIIEETLIGPQLGDTAFIYISAWNIPVLAENIGYFKKMVNQYNFFPMVRADARGYYMVFESESLATACFNRFKTKTFRRQLTNMQLCKSGKGLSNLQ